LKINDEPNLEKSIEYGRKWYKKYVIDNHFSMSLDENDKKWLQEELGNNVI
jgi:lysyl-tRNA synthetase class I